VRVFVHSVLLFNLFVGNIPIEITKDWPVHFKALNVFVFSNGKMTTSSGFIVMQQPPSKCGSMNTTSSEGGIPNTSEYTDIDEFVWQNVFYVESNSILNTPWFACVYGLPSQREGVSRSFASLQYEVQYVVEIFVVRWASWDSFQVYVHYLRWRYSVIFQGGEDGEFCILIIPNDSTVYVKSNRYNWPGSYIKGFETQIICRLSGFGGGRSGIGGLSSQLKASRHGFSLIPHDLLLGLANSMHSRHSVGLSSGCNSIVASHPQEISHVVSLGISEACELPGGCPKSASEDCSCRDSNRSDRVVVKPCPEAIPPSNYELNKQGVNGLILIVGIVVALYAAAGGKKKDLGDNGHPNRKAGDQDD
jgi:hypothetical protein